jgi:hypothetical protein
MLQPATTGAQATSRQYNHRHVLGEKMIKPSSPVRTRLEIRAAPLRKGWDDKRDARIVQEESANGLAISSYFSSLPRR